MENECFLISKKTFYSHIFLTSQNFFVSELFMVNVIAFMGDNDWDKTMQNSEYDHLFISLNSSRD